MTFNYSKIYIDESSYQIIYLYLDENFVDLKVKEARKIIYKNGIEEDTEEIVLVIL